MAKRKAAPKAKKTKAEAPVEPPKDEAPKVEEPKAPAAKKPRKRKAPAKKKAEAPKEKPAVKEEAVHIPTEFIHDNPDVVLKILFEGIQAGNIKANDSFKAKQAVADAEYWMFKADKK